jgi:hypothetical protein
LSLDPSKSFAHLDRLLANLWHLVKQISAGALLALNASVYALPVFRAVIRVGVVEGEPGAVVLGARLARRGNGVGDGAGLGRDSLNS